jgi:hypothetical protein
VTGEKEVADELRESNCRHAAALDIVGAVGYEWNTASDQVVWSGNYVRQEHERSADAIVAAIHDSVTAFADGQPQSDDMAVAIAKAL